MRTVRKVHRAESRPIADLATHSPMPTRHLDMIDPFLFLNHHGPQHYPANNQGLPFGPHPHRGMETVTVILSGDIVHKDSGGHDSVIHPGGVQWMTAGKGLIHSEVSSEEFKKSGGPLEILQLWVNLPARLKMTPPNYRGLQKEEIPVWTSANGKSKAQVISGRIGETYGAFDTLTPITLATLFLEEEGKFEINVPKEHNILCYMIRGRCQANETSLPELHLAEFEHDDESISIKAVTDSILLFGHAAPFEEPVVARGPFVMNTMEEINQAYQDYQQGKMGSA